MVGTPGLKPGTYRLRGESSNQLSYIPKMERVFGHVCVLGYVNPPRKSGGSTLYPL